jgi:hypothetical protein
LEGSTHILSLSFLTRFQIAVFESLWISDRALATLLRLESCFKHFASLGLRLEDIKKSQHYNPEDIKVTPEDCANLLILTKSLIKYVEDLGVTGQKG